MAGKGTIKLRFETLHRYWAGIMIVCLVVTVIASAIAGASTTEVLRRSIFAMTGLYIIGQVIIRSWASWEEMSTRSELKKRR